MESKEFGLRNRVMTTRKWFWTKRHQYNSHIPNPKVWDPNGNGWEVSNDGYLKPLMYTNELAPLEVRNLTHMYCTDIECTVARKCHCLQTGLKCTELCACFGHECANDTFDTETDSDDEEDDD